MNVLITGSNGLVGSNVVSMLSGAGHRVTRLVRSQPRKEAGELYWNPESENVDLNGWEGQHAIVHLAGDTISERWTKPKKVRIRESRVKGTRLLCESLGRMKQPPNVLISASAIGYYGDRGEELLTEESDPGAGYLSEVCQEWESAAGLAAQWGIRVVRLRIGIVLSAAGGALKKMLPPFKIGVGGKIGSGRQYMSWIALDDLVGIISHALLDEKLTGAVNAVSPSPVTNLEFTKVLGTVLGRPTIFPLPAFAVRLAFGEMGQELLLASTRVQPAKLQSAGYRFRYPDIDRALRGVLRKPAQP